MITRVRLHGFSLVELIIVIAVLAIVSTAIVVSIDPVRRIEAGKNTKRAADVAAISHAAAMRLADGDDLPGVDGEWRMIGTAEDECDVSCGAEAFRGNGIDSYVSITPAAEGVSLPKAGEEPVTFAFWVKPDGNKSVYLFDDAGDDSVTYRAALLNRFLSVRVEGTEGSRVIWRSKNMIQSYQDTLADNTLSEYYHITLVVDPDSGAAFDDSCTDENVAIVPPPEGAFHADKISVYINGKSAERDLCEPSNHISGSVEPKNTLRIGGRTINNENFFFQGVIDDFRVYKGILGDEDIALLQNAQETEAAAPVLHFTFRESTGAEAHDAMGNFRGTMHGENPWSTESHPHLMTSKTQSSCIDLHQELVASRYLSSMPVNPTAGNITPTEERTYYAIKRNGPFVAVRSCLNEGSLSGLLGSTPMIESLRGSLLEENGH